MSWLQTPECFPDDINQQLVKMSQMGGSEQNAMMECICDALSSIEEGEDPYEFAVNMCAEFQSQAQDLKNYFENSKPPC